MARFWIRGLACVFVTVGTARAQGVQIEHQAAACVVADKFPRFEARLAPPDAVATARILFQGDTQDWYSVVMKPNGPVHVGILPKPKKSLKAFRYYVEVTDKTLETHRTAEYTATVVPSSGQCNGRLMAASLGSASILLQGPAGVVAIPAGFASSGVVAAGTVAGSTAGATTGAAAGGGSAGGAGAGSAAAAAGGGGLGATALVVGGLAAGGAVAVGVAAKSGGDGDGDNSSNTNQGIRIDVIIVSSSGTSGTASTPQIDISACRANTTFGGGPITLRSDGSFDETWSTSTPALRVFGRADANSLQATLNCSGGAGPTGSLSANGSGYNLSGTFSFGSSSFGSQGVISVRRVQ